MIEKLLHVASRPAPTVAAVKAGNACGRTAQHDRLCWPVGGPGGRTARRCRRTTVRAARHSWPGSVSQYCNRSLPEVGPRLPADTNVDSPSHARRSRQDSRCPGATDWQKNPARAHGQAGGRPGGVSGRPDRVHTPEAFGRPRACRVRGPRVTVAARRSPSGTRSRRILNDSNHQCRHALARPASIQASIRPQAPHDREIQRIRDVANGGRPARPAPTGAQELTGRPDRRSPRDKQVGAHA